MKITALLALASTVFANAVTPACRVTLGGKLTPQNTKQKIVRAVTSFINEVNAYAFSLTFEEEVFKPKEEVQYVPGVRQIDSFDSVATAGCGVCEVYTESLFIVPFTIQGGDPLYSFPFNRILTAYGVERVLVTLTLHFFFIFFQQTSIQIYPRILSLIIHSTFFVTVLNHGKHKKLSNYRNHSRNETKT